MGLKVLPRFLMESLSLPCAVGGRETGNGREKSPSLNSLSGGMLFTGILRGTLHASKLQIPSFFWANVQMH